MSRTRPPSESAARPSTVAERLRIAAGSRILLWKGVDGAREALEPLPADCRVVTRLTGEFDVAVLYPPDRAALESVAASIGDRLADDARLWVAFPTGRTPEPDRPGREECREVFEAAGFHALVQVALGPGWSALRLSVDPPPEPDAP